MYQFQQTIDQFGIEQKLQVPQINPTQKSLLGGIVTFTLYSLSLAYFIYQLIDWIENNKLPKYFTMQKQINSNQNISCSGLFAEIQAFELQDDSYIDPFDPENLIFYPILNLVSSDLSQDQFINVTFAQEKREDQSTINKFQVNDVTFVGDPNFSKDNQQQEYFLSLQWCDESLIDSSQFKCADKDKIQQFFEKQNLIQISKNPCKRHQKVFLVDVIQNQLQYVEVQLSLNQLKVDDGFLLPNSKQVDFFQSLSPSFFQYNADYSKKYYGEELSVVIYFVVDQLQWESVVEYPKISEVLADTGSIISIFMQVSFLVFKYNEFLGNRRVVEDILKMYYKDYNLYRIQKNWKGQIKNITKGKIIYEQRNVLDFFFQLEKTAFRKVSYQNVQFEISRLQFLVQKLLPTEQIKNNLCITNTIDSCINMILQLKQENLEHSRNQILPNSDNEKQAEGYSEIIEQEIQRTVGLLTFQSKSSSLAAEVPDDLQINNFHITNI